MEVNDEFWQVAGAMDNLRNEWTGARSITQMHPQHALQARHLAADRRSSWRAAPEKLPASFTRAKTVISGR